MIEAFKKNRPAAISIVAAMCVLLLGSVLSACQVDDLVKVDVPTGVATAIDSGERIPVSATDAAWEDWTAWVERESTRFADEIDDGKRTVGVLTSLAETGIRVGQDAASTIPGGAILGSGLALLGGLFLRRPGDAKREQAEKDAAYNAGREQGESLAKTVIEGVESLKQQQGNGQT
jgi:hypothetical protein